MIKVELEIGDNLKEVINLIVKVTTKENHRITDGKLMSPGREIEKAFKIDFTKIVLELLKTPRSFTDKDKNIKHKIGE